MGRPKKDEISASDHKKVRRGSKPFTEVLHQELLREPDRATLRRLARKLIKLAGEGDHKSLQELVNRLDGKPVTPIDTEQAIRVKVEM